MKILVVSFNYHPLVNPRSLRWTALCEDWVKKGHEVHVVCSRVFGAVDEERVEGVYIHRVGPENTSTLGKSSYQEPLWKRALRPIYRKTVKALVWPDSNFMWIKPAEAKISEVVKKLDPDHIVSVSHPFSSHVAVLNYVKSSKISCPWSIDSGDPFSFIDGVNINNSLLFKKKNFKVEQEIIEKACHSFVTTKETQELYKEYFPSSQEKTHVVGPLLRPSLATGKKSSQDLDKWVYAGTLYKNIRNPKELLKAFKRYLEFKPQAELHFYGAVNDCQSEFAKYQELLGHCIYIHGLISATELESKCEEAGVLINIGNKTHYQLPSKLIEYMALGKPILNFSSVPKDSSARLLESYPRAFTHLQDEDLGKLMDILKSWGQQELGSLSDIQNLLQPYQLDNISSRYLKYLEEGK